MKTVTQAIVPVKPVAPKSTTVSCEGCDHAAFIKGCKSRRGDYYPGDEPHHECDLSGCWCGEDLPIEECGKYDPATSAFCPWCWETSGQMNLGWIDIETGKALCGHCGEEWDITPDHHNHERRAD